VACYIYIYIFLLESSYLLSSIVILKCLWFYYTVEGTVSTVYFILNFLLQDKYVAEEVTQKDGGGPLMMNAFEMITLSQGLNLSALFDRQQVIPISF
jgi:hypothetical protein